MLSLKELNLRQITVRDLDLMLKWRNSESVRHYMLDDHIITLKEHREWYQRICKDPACEWLIAIFHSSPIGVVSITDIKKMDGTCTWGMYIGENMRNSGIGILMEIRAIDHMVEYHKIRKIWGETLESNKRLILMHKRFGFKEEGVLKKHVSRGGKYEDVIRTAMFTHNWEAIRGEIVRTFRLDDNI
tara:strand:+ start:140 stop:700 length:561 start_codon:yes stop_codon:yes gene_type:complete